MFGVAELASLNIKTPLASPAHQYSIVIAFVLITKCVVGPEHRMSNAFNIHTISAKSNSAYLMPLITGAFVHTERKQINNEKQNSYLVFALNLFRVGPTPYNSLTLEL